VRVANAMDRSGVSFDDYPGHKKPPCGIASAQERAIWLHEHTRFVGQGKRELVSGQDWENRLKGRTGIAFFKDYWKRDTDKGNHTTRDHIDLWNKNTLTRYGWGSFFRFTLGVSRAGHLFSEGNCFSDLGKSSEIWFWPVK
jgi:hypothetical protein